MESFHDLELYVFALRVPEFTSTNVLNHGGTTWSIFIILKKIIKLFCAFVCLSLSLKKLGDFTMFEGHGYPLVVLISLLSPLAFFLLLKSLDHTNPKPH